MGFPAPRRLAAAVLVAAISVMMIGCGSHERVETALARAAFVNTSTAQAFAAPAPQYAVSAAPMTVAPVVGQPGYATPRPAASAKMTTSSAAPTAAAADANGDLRVMSFNLRVPFLLDATNHWGFRKNNV